MPPLASTQVLLTGASGFIGSHVTRALVLAGHRVLALRRGSSDLSRCGDFSRRVQWLNMEDADWSRTVVAFRPSVVIHCAWAGVTAAERDDWRLQFRNLAFFSDLLLFAGEAGASQFIVFGSQAEYGPIDGRVDESHACRPTTAYGATKLACLALLESFARQRGMLYVWLRLFSIYGPGEGASWFIPSLVRQFRDGAVPQLTACEQCYDYLHTCDLAEGVLAVMARPQHTGVFNLSSGTSVRLKDLVTRIRQLTGAKFEPAFGALPYRPGQSMRIEGDNARFIEAFCLRPKITLEDGLREVVKSIL